MAAIKKFGYGRVSSKDQNEGRQLESLQAAGVEERDIYIDKKSGKDFDREKYQLMKPQLREGDILYIHSLDRLGRNKEGILDEWNDITKKIKADIIVLDMPLLDTTKYKDSMGTFIADLVLQILSWMAEEERNKIRTRQREGIDLAKKNGVHLGRPKTELPEDFAAIYAAWKAGEITGVQATTAAKTSKATFYKMVKEYEAQEPQEDRCSCEDCQAAREHNSQQLTIHDKWTLDGLPNVTPPTPETLAWVKQIQEERRNASRTDKTNN